jgi:UDP-3-O-[3-hydroxymyristoyl] glucosamine N-acyltransferase
LDDTIIGNGVKIDNQVMIAHNVHIGDHTAIAGCVGIAGSAVIGKHCTLAGGVGIVGHISITDNVHVTGMTMVTHSIKEAGAYSSGTPFQKNSDWLKNAVRFKQLDKLTKKINTLIKSQKGST